MVNNLWRARISNYCKALQRTELLGLTGPLFVVVNTDTYLHFALKVFHACSRDLGILSSP